MFTTFLSRTSHRTRRGKIHKVKKVYLGPTTRGQRKLSSKMSKKRSPLTLRRVTKLRRRNTKIRETQSLNSSKTSLKMHQLLISLEILSSSRSTKTKLSKNTKAKLPLISEAEMSLPSQSPTPISFKRKTSKSSSLFLSIEIQ